MHDSSAARTTAIEHLTPTIRLGALFPDHQVFAKCEFLAPSGCFKIRGANHLLDRLQSRGDRPELIVPSMGNTAVGAATAARERGVRMTGVVPRSISAAKDEKLRALGVDLLKVDGGGSDLLGVAMDLAEQRGGYFAHPHLDPQWTDGYRAIAAELLDELPTCRSIVLPLGGGGLLMGLIDGLRGQPQRPRLYACEPYSYPKYAAFSHERTASIADGLLLEKPHPAVQAAIAGANVTVAMVTEDDIRTAIRDLYETHALVVEPSSAITTAYVRAQGAELQPPVCVILTGENISHELHRRIIGTAG